MNVLYKLCRAIAPHGTVPVGSQAVKVYMNGLGPDHKVHQRVSDDPRDPLAQAAIVLRISGVTWIELLEDGGERTPNDVTVDVVIYLPSTPCPAGNLPDGTAPPFDTLDLLLPFLAAVDGKGLAYDPPVFVDSDLIDVVGDAVDSLVQITFSYRSLTMLQEE